MNIILALSNTTLENASDSGLSEFTIYLVTDAVAGDDQLDLSHTQDIMFVPDNKIGSTISTARMAEHLNF